MSAVPGAVSLESGILTLRRESKEGVPQEREPDGFTSSLREWEGDFVIEARLAACDPPRGGICAAGLMVRESLSPRSRSVFAYWYGADPEHKLQSTYRTWNGDRIRRGISISWGKRVPYQKIVRFRDEISLYASDDGKQWSWVNGFTLTDLPERVYAGVALAGSRSAAAAEVSFQQVVIRPLEIAYTTSWFGNSLPGGSASIPQVVATISWEPGPDGGRLLTNSIWDEAGQEAALFDARGRLLGRLDDTHGWLRLGGLAITSGAGHLYMAMEQAHMDLPGYPAEKDTIWYCVRRYNEDGTPAPVPGGDGHDGSFRIVSRARNGADRRIRGLAWSAAAGRLYASDTVGDAIRIYDADLEDLGAFPARPPIPRPRALGVDPRDGSLWAVSGPADEAKVLHYGADGRKMPEEISPAGWRPEGIAVDPEGRIWVADDGPDQQVKTFGPDGKPAGTLGVKGGIYSGVPGETGPLKLAGPLGVAVDGAGNVYVAAGAGTGTELRKFGPGGSPLFAKYGLEFIDAADADPATDGADVFTKIHHYRMDYAKPAGEEWTYAGLTLDRFAYPEDIRLHPHAVKTGGVMVRRRDGRRFMFLAPVHGAPFGIYRFDGEIAIPCGVLAPDWRRPSSWPSGLPKGYTRWIWIDRDGNGRMDDPNEYEPDSPPVGHTYGWYVDDNLDIWMASEGARAGQPDVRRYRASLDPNRPEACPVYDRADVDDFHRGKEFDPEGEILGVLRARYVSATDTMYLGAYTKTHPKDPNSPEFGMVGREILRYDDWTGRDPARSPRSLRWRATLPYDPAGISKNVIHGAKSMAVAGDRVYAIMGDTKEILVYDARTGEPMPGKAMEPGPEVAGRSGFIDVLNGINAFRRADGEYLVFAEEDGQAKGLLYRERR